MVQKAIYYVHFSIYLLCVYIGIPKKMTSSFREGGIGQKMRLAYAEGRGA